MSKIFDTRVSAELASQLAKSVRELDDTHTGKMNVTKVEPCSGGVAVVGTGGEKTVPQTTPLTEVRTFLHDGKLKIIAMSEPATNFGGTNEPTDPKTPNAEYITDVWNLVSKNGAIVNSIANNMSDAMKEQPKEAFKNIRKIITKFENTPKGVKKTLDLLNDDLEAGLRAGQASSMMWAAVVKPHTKMDDNGNDVTSWQLVLSTPLFQDRKGDDADAIEADLALFNDQSEVHAFQATHPELKPRELMFHPMCGGKSVNWPGALTGKYAGSSQFMGKIDWVVKGARFIPSRNRIVASCYVNGVHVAAMIGKSGGSGGAAAAPVVNDQQRNLIKRTFDMATGGADEHEDDDESDSKRTKM